MSFSTSNPIPTTGYIRQKELLGNRKSVPPVPPIFPISATTLWVKVKDGSFPAPVKPFGPRITCWRVEDIRKFIESAGEAKP